MFAKLSKGLAHKGGGKTALKFRFEVAIDRLDNLPQAVKKCRVVWCRGSKIQMTEIVDAAGGASRVCVARCAARAAACCMRLSRCAVRFLLLRHAAPSPHTHAPRPYPYAGVATFGQQRLAMVATLYRDAATGALEEKARCRVDGDIVCVPIAAASPRRKRSCCACAETDTPTTQLHHQLHHNRSTPSRCRCPRRAAAAAAPPPRC